MLRQRVSRFLADAASEAFDDLARDVLQFQLERIEPLRRLAAARGVDQADVGDWRRVPPVPTLAFKTMALHADEPRVVFRSSGTRGARSEHHQPYPELYQQAVDASFPAWCLLGMHRPPMLSLVPPPEVAPDSSLSFMVAHVLAAHGGEGSLFACGPRGVDVAAARSWLAARQRQGRPVVVLATSLALDHLLGSLHRRYLHFRLPPSSVVFDTGGFKGREREVAPEDLLARVEEYLGLPASQVVREYGMTELSSQCYSGTLYGRPLDVFEAPHWLAVRVLDPQTLAEQPAGEAGLLAFCDLANLGSVAAVLSEDLAVAVPGGFRLLGRAGDAELRGCSLTAEELAAGAPPPAR